MIFAAKKIPAPNNDHDGDKDGDEFLLELQGGRNVLNFLSDIQQLSEAPHKLAMLSSTGIGTFALRYQTARWVVGEVRIRSTPKKFTTNAFHLEPNVLFSQMLSYQRMGLLAECCRSAS